MIDEHLLVSRMSEFNESIASVTAYAETLRGKVNNSSNNYNEGDYENLLSISEDTYRHLLDGLLSIQDIMMLLQVENERHPTPIFEEVFPLLSEKSGIDLAVDFTEPHVVSCRILAPPILKNYKTQRSYAHFFRTIIEHEVAEKCPHNFVKFSSVYVIYVNHFVTGQLTKQPYFDNDNLQIKAILDAIIPFICYDDAFKFCDNLYLAQEDSLNFAELFIVEKGWLHAWILKNRTLDFTKEIESLF